MCQECTKECRKGALIGLNECVKSDERVFYECTKGCVKSVLEVCLTFRMYCHTVP